MVKQFIKILNYISDKKWEMLDIWRLWRWWLLTMEDGGKILQVFFLLLATSDAFGKSIEVMVQWGKRRNRSWKVLLVTTFLMIIVAINFPVRSSQVLVAQKLDLSMLMLLTTPHCTLHMSIQSAVNKFPPAAQLKGAQRLKWPDTSSASLRIATPISCHWYKSSSSCIRVTTQ